MKRIIYITILALMLLAACTKPSPAPAPAPEQYDRYIFFSHSVETKASLIEDASGMSGKSFGVVGFKYDERTDWATYSTTEVNGNLPEPNVFYDDDNTTSVDVETVGVDGTRNENEATIGTASYTPLQGWSNSKKYTFFAFYPVENSAVSLVNLDGEPYSGGVPAVKYTNKNHSLDAMVDLMTAKFDTEIHQDRYWKSAEENNITSGQINFTFEHCLSCLDAEIVNASNGVITVNSIQFVLSNIAYDQITIPLDGTSVKKNPTTVTNKTTDITIQPAIDDASLAAGKSQKLTDKLIFIPQDDENDGALAIIAKINYTRKAVDGSGYSDLTTTFETPQLTTKLSKGNKYLINIKFTDSTVSASAIVVEKGWIEIPDVNNSFK